MARANANKTLFEVRSVRHGGITPPPPSPPPPPPQRIVYNRKQQNYAETQGPVEAPSPKTNTTPPAQTAKKKHAHRPKQQRTNTLGRGGGVCIFLLFGRGRCVFLALWAGPAPPPKQQKMKHAPAQTGKKSPEKPKQQKTPDNKTEINTLTGSSCMISNTIRGVLDSALGPEIILASTTFEGPIKATPKMAQRPTTDPLSSSGCSLGVCTSVVKWLWLLALSFEVQCCCLVPNGQPTDHTDFHRRFCRNYYRDQFFQP